MLAHLPPDDLAQRLKRTLTPCTPHSIIDRAAFDAELARVREQGYALNDEELEIGLRAVAAPICDHGSHVVAAINVTGSVRTISRSRMVDELAPQVRETAVLISRALGYGG